MKKLSPSVILFFGILSCTYEHVESLSSKCTNSDLALTLTSKNASSCSASDGSITATALGGAKKYTFSLNGGTYQSSSSFSSLPGGNYIVVVMDSLGCTTSQVSTINNDGTSLQLTATATPNTGCPVANGAITVAVSDATAPVQYKLNSNSFQSANTFTGLIAGTYSITVTDATGCQASASVSVMGGPSFSATISPIITSQCASSRCHDGSRNPTLTSNLAIKANGAAIVSAINRNMPPGGGLTQTQINEITCWVNNGAPNN